MKKIKQKVVITEYNKNWNDINIESFYRQNSNLNFHTLKKLQEIQLQEYIKSAKEVMIMEDQLQLKLTCQILN